MGQESDKSAPDGSRGMDELKDRLAQGAYAVDPSAVAEAILRRTRDLALLRASGDGFSACG